MTPNDALSVHPYTCGECRWEGPSKMAYYRHCLVERHDHWENIAALQWRSERRSRLLALAASRRATLDAERARHATLDVERLHSLTCGQGQHVWRLDPDGILSDCRYIATVYAALNEEPTDA